MSTLKTVIGAAGGPTKASKACGISVRAIYKWLDAGALPRTEYTGETQYSESLAEASGDQFSAEEIRERCRPGARSSAA